MAPHDTARETASLIGQFILWAQEIQDLNGVALVGPEHKRAINVAAQQLYAYVREASKAQRAAPKLDLAAVRATTGLSNRQIAARLGVPLRTLESYQYGARGLPERVALRLKAIQSEGTRCPTCAQPVSLATIPDTTTA